MKKSTKVFKVSDPSKNVYGFSVDTAGIRLDNFLLNPVCLLNHNYDKIMGTWVDLSLSGQSLTGVPVLDEQDPEAVNMFSKIEQDLLKGASIGIIPLAVKDGVIIDSDLLEISLTPVPANRSALVLYNSKGVALSIEEAKTYCLNIQQDTNPDFKIMNEKLKAALVALSVQAGLTIQLSAEAKDEDVLNVIEKVGNKITALSLTNVQLKAANDEFATKAAAELKAAGEQMVDAAIGDKRITADKRETFLKLYAADAGLCKSTLEALKPVTLSIIPGAAAAAAEKTEGRENWTFDEYMKNDAVALNAMQVTDPEKFNTLYQAKVVALKAVGAIA